MESGTRSFLCFVLAIVLVLCVVSVSSSNWIIHEMSKFGILQECSKIVGEPEKCWTPDFSNTQWLLSLVGILVGCLCVTVVIILLIYSKWDDYLLPLVGSIISVGAVFVCSAALTFPLGFSHLSMESQMFHLPQDFSVGSSYVTFSLALVVLSLCQLALVETARNGYRNFS
ncbi:hypothetical protein TCAL_15334 [Tigriopus californicus]|uniref:Uncharacterized protein n=1 Tax=Tigriopus californicus TaxID=6832 RepID=A0A553PKF1_TIGCA|nr:hypothetical protein TCAL_15334 [Tigriopus californicus]